MSAPIKAHPFSPQVLTPTVVGLKTISTEAHQQALEIIKFFDLDSPEKPMDVAKLNQWVTGKGELKSDPHLTVRIGSMAYLILYGHRLANEKTRLFLQTLKPTILGVGTNAWREAEIRKLVEIKEGIKLESYFSVLPAATFNQVDNIPAPLNLPQPMVDPFEVNTAETEPVFALPTNLLPIAPLPPTQPEPVRALRRRGRPAKTQPPAAANPPAATRAGKRRAPAHPTVTRIPSPPRLEAPDDYDIKQFLNH